MGERRSRVMLARESTLSAPRTSRGLHSYGCYAVFDWRNYNINQSGIKNYGGTMHNSGGCTQITDTQMNGKTYTLEILQCKTIVQDNY